MRNKLRRYAVGALAAGAVAGTAAFAMPGTAAHPTSLEPTLVVPAVTPAVVQTEAPQTGVKSGVKAEATVAATVKATVEASIKKTVPALPATITKAQPVRVVTTTLDSTGRPIVSVRTATDRTTAADYVADGTKAASVELDTEVHALDAPTGTDPYRSDQWDFAKINVTGAWQYSTGSGVTVAVIDTGVDASHPDLAGQVLPEYDVINSKTVSPSTDENGHGTHVAGTIAALTGNGVGVSSIAPDAKILPIRVLAADGSGSMADAATGIVYAADHGADVINMSLGSTEQLDAVTEAIAYARSKGVVVVAAAGNSREKGSPTSYPGADPGVIAVAATDSSDKVASYSNAGSYVDVAAPGSDILSTYKDDYYYMSGTSMASPHVAAVAALIKGENPSLTPDQVESAIENTAVDLGTPGKDNDYGYGRIDAAAAVADAATMSPTTTTTTPTVTAATTSALVKYGSSQTAKFTLQNDGSAAAATTAEVCVSVKSAAYTCSVKTTNSAGVVSVTHSATAPFRVKVVYSSAQATSAYQVQATATLAKTSATGVTVTVGGADKQPVAVQRLNGSSWVTVKTVKATASKITVTGLAKKKKYRAVVASSSNFTGVTSNTAQL